MLTASGISLCNRMAPALLSSCSSTTRVWFKTGFSVASQSCKHCYTRCASDETAARSVCGTAGQSWACPCLTMTMQPFLCLYMRSLFAACGPLDYSAVRMCSAYTGVAASTPTEGLLPEPERHSVRLVTTHSASCVCMLIGSRKQKLSIGVSLVVCSRGECTLYSCSVALEFEVTTKDYMCRVSSGRHTSH